MKLDEIRAEAESRLKDPRVPQASLYRKDAKVILALVEIAEAVLMDFHGQPCYRTSHDIPMGMPRSVERKVRAALAKLEKL